MKSGFLIRNLHDDKKFSGRESYTSLEKERGFYSKMDSPVKHRDFFSKPFLSNWELDRGLEIR